MTQILGTTYRTTIATLSDDATIVDAFKYFYQGGLSNSPAANSVEQHLINVNNRVDGVNTQLGYTGVSPVPASVHVRIASLENIVGTTLAADYVKTRPSSNDVASTSNLISPTTASVVPMTVQGVLGQQADLQRWRNSAEVSLARIDSLGRIFASNGVSSGDPVEVVTVSGNQTITNKTFSNPIQTIATNAKTSSYTLQSSDQSKMIEMSNGGTLTIPNESTATIFPIGTYIVVLQTGTSQVTIAGSGFTPSATPGLKLRTQWSMAALIKRGTNSWVVSGDVIP